MGTEGKRRDIGVEGDSERSVDVGRPHRRADLILLAPNGAGRSWVPGGYCVQEWRWGPTVVTMFVGRNSGQ